MAKQTVNLGTMADNKSGDPLRTAFTKINQNFDELYAGASVGNTVSKTGGVDLQNAVALDLTKSINKLTAGYYTLANGTEGQILRVVRQTGLQNTDVTRIYVTNKCRIAGSEYTNNYIEPFVNGADVVTFIYTDDAWQSIGGQWD